MAYNCGMKYEMETIVNCCYNYSDNILLFTSVMFTETYLITPYKNGINT